MFNEELPKILASAADNAKKFQAALDDLATLVSRLKGDLAGAGPLLSQAHQQLLAADPAAFQPLPNPVIKPAAPPQSPPKPVPPPEPVKPVVPEEKK
jgi:hypothetical protein